MESPIGCLDVVLFVCVLERVCVCVCVVISLKMQISSRTWGILQRRDYAVQEAININSIVLLLLLHGHKRAELGEEGWGEVGGGVFVGSGLAGRQS